MQITVSVLDLVQYLIWLLMAGSSIAVLVSLYFQRKAKKKLRAQWMGAGPLAHTHIRYSRFMQEPLRIHQEQCPNDLHCMFVMVRSASGVDPMVMHKDGVRDLKTWSEGAGLDLCTLVADTLAAYEQHLPGMIPVVQVMLDERKDKLRQEEVRRRTG